MDFFVYIYSVQLIKTMKTSQELSIQFAKGKAERTLKGLVDAFNAITGSEEADNNAKEAMQKRIDKQQIIVNRYV